MHLAFLAALITIVAVLYMPGYVLLRAFRFSRIISLVGAPLPGIAVLTAIPVAYYALGIPCSFFNVAGPTLAVCLACYAVSLAMRRTKAHESERNGHGENDLIRLPSGESRFDWLMLLAYIALGALVCYYVYYRSLGGADSFYSRWDNLTHLNLIQAFLDTGQWSTLHADRYLDLAQTSRPTNPPQGYYPAAWHVTIALACSLTGAEVTTASNALVVVAASITFPAGMFLLNRAIFGDDRLVIAGGAIATVAFATYPWIFPLRGPTLPNLYGFAIMVPFLAIFVTFLENHCIKAHIAGLAVFLASSFISMALTHPAAIFTSYIILAAYGGHFIFRLVSGRADGRIAGKRAAVLATISFELILVAFWAILLTLPLGVLSYRYDHPTSVAKALYMLVTLKFDNSKPQILLVLVILAGIAFALKRKSFWLLIPAAYFALGFVAAKTSWQPIQYIITGFWYSTPYRMNACIAVALMPIASLGLGECARLAVRLAKRLITGHSTRTTAIATVAAVFLIFSAINSSHRFHRQSITTRPSRPVSAK